MKEISNVTKKVKYISYIYDSTEEKNEHIKDMENSDYECLDRFEDQFQATFRKFYD